MIDIIRQQFAQNSSSEEKLNKTREFLQILLLKIIYDKNLFRNLAFVGGTALRILYDLRRFSEDIDFSLVNKKGYDFPEINRELINALGLYGLSVQTKTKEVKTVHSSLLKFPGLLKNLGLSALEKQNLSIKIEIDTNPPHGWKVENTAVNKVYMFNIVHFDLPSSFATKLHACFYRKFVKGRDFYDLIWYLTKKIQPNFTLLNNAIHQTEGRSPEINEGNFNKFLLSNIGKIDFKDVGKDVGRFLEDKNELKLLNLKAIQKMITG